MLNTFLSAHLRDFFFYDHRQAYQPFRPFPPPAAGFALSVLVLCVYMCVFMCLCYVFICLFLCVVLLLCVLFLCDVFIDCVFLRRSFVC